MSAYVFTALAWGMVCAREKESVCQCGVPRVFVMRTNAFCPLKRCFATHSFPRTLSLSSITVHSTSLTPVQYGCNMTADTCSSMSPHCSVWRASHWPTHRITHTNTHSPHTHLPLRQGRSSLPLLRLRLTVKRVECCHMFLAPFNEAVSPCFRSLASPDCLPCSSRWTRLRAPTTPFYSLALQGFQETNKGLLQPLLHAACSCPPAIQR